MGNNLGGTRTIEDTRKMKQQNKVKEAVYVFLGAFLIAGGYPAILLSILEISEINLALSILIVLVGIGAVGTGVYLLNKSWRLYDN